MDKLPFDIGVALARIEQAVQPWPKAALFQLAEEGYASVFEQLLACNRPHCSTCPVLDMCKQVGVTEHR